MRVERTNRCHRSWEQSQRTLGTKLEDDGLSRMTGVVAGQGIPGQRGVSFYNC